MDAIDCILKRLVKNSSADHVRVIGANLRNPRIGV